MEEPAASPAHLLALQTERNATRHASDERGSADAAALQQRIIADASSASLVRLMLVCAVFWLLLASAFGLISSIAASAGLAVGRHVADVWRNSHLAFERSGVWLGADGLPWLCDLDVAAFVENAAAGAGYAMFGCAVWNLGLIAGLIGIANGYNNGLEWLEIPRPLAALLVVGAVLYRHAVAGNAATTQGRASVRIGVVPSAPRCCGCRFC